MTTQGTTTITATPAKLQDGSWGARVQGHAPAVGDTITIRTRAGKTWEAEVTRLVWSGPNVAIVATSKSGGRSTAGRGSVSSRAAASTRRSGGRACRECGGFVQSWSDGARNGLCHDCV